MNDTKTMERTALDSFPGLIRALGERAAAMEVICGVFRTGDMRPVFLESVFGREIAEQAKLLTGRHGPDGWQQLYPSMWSAVQFLRAEGFPCL